jgi:hypothetical protein
MKGGSAYAQIREKISHLWAVFMRILSLLF